jgi:hypothetical protein
LFAEEEKSWGESFLAVADQGFVVTQGQGKLSVHQSSAGEADHSIIVS